MNISSVQVFVTSVCNLNCEYCFMSKNPANKRIDKEVEANVVKDLYFEEVKNIIDKEALKELELWGGEPLLGINRVGDNIRLYLDYFPNIEDIRIVTNLTENIDGLLSFIKRLDSYGKKLKLTLQVSLDGPLNVMSITRGEYAYEGIIKNSKYLVDNMEQTNNVRVYMCFKPTLSLNALREMDKDIKGYHEFYIEFSKGLIAAKKNTNLYIECGTPTTVAIPGEYTAEDGRFFADFYKRLLELKPYFLEKYNLDIDFIAKKKDNVLKVMRTGGRFTNCGAGFDSKLGIKGNGEYSICQRGMLDSDPEYLAMAKEAREKNNKGQEFLGEVDKMKMASRELSFRAGDEAYNRRIYANNYEGNKLQISANIAMIYQASLSGQADEVYSKDMDKLVRAAYLLRAFQVCMYDNVIVTGSMSIRPMSVVKLYANGILEMLAEQLEGMEDMDDDTQGREQQVDQRLYGADCI